MNVTFWLYFTFAFGIIVGAAIMFVMRLFSGIDHTYATLRIALAKSIASMSEDAHDSDGYTDRQIAIITEYGPLIGFTLSETTDKWDNPCYTIRPIPSDVVRRLAAELEGA